MISNRLRGGYRAQIDRSMGFHRHLMVGRIHAVFVQLQMCNTGTHCEPNGWIVQEIRIIKRINAITKWSWLNMWMRQIYTFCSVTHNFRGFFFGANSFLFIGELRHLLRFYSMYLLKTCAVHSLCPPERQIIFHESKPFETIGILSFTLNKFSIPFNCQLNSGGRLMRIFHSIFPLKLIGFFCCCWFE